MVDGVGSGAVVDGVGSGSGVVVDGVGSGSGVVVDGVGSGSGVVVDGVGSGSGVVVDGVGSGVVVDGVGVGVFFLSASTSPQPAVLMTILFSATWSLTTAVFLKALPTLALAGTLSSV